MSERQMSAVDDAITKVGRHVRLSNGYGETGSLTSAISAVAWGLVAVAEAIREKNTTD